MRFGFYMRSLALEYAVGAKREKFSSIELFASTAIARGKFDMYELRSCAVHSLPSITHLLYIHFDYCTLHTEYYLCSGILTLEIELLTIFEIHIVGVVLFNVHRFYVPPRVFRCRFLLHIPILLLFIFIPPFSSLLYYLV